MAFAPVGEAVGPAGSWTRHQGGHTQQNPSIIIIIIMIVQIDTTEETGSSHAWPGDGGTTLESNCRVQTDEQEKEREREH